MRPPATLWECDTFDTCSRRRADVTWRAPTPLTRTRKNACLAGLASTSRRAPVPLFFAGVALFSGGSAPPVPPGAPPGGGGGGGAGGGAPAAPGGRWGRGGWRRGAGAVGAAAAGAARAVGPVALLARLVHLLVAAHGAGEVRRPVDADTGAGGARRGHFHQRVGGLARPVVDDGRGVAGVAVRDEELREVEGRALEAYPVGGQRLQEGDDVRPAIRLPDEAADAVDGGVGVGSVCLVEIAAPGVELHHLVEGEHAAVVHVGGGQLDVAERRCLERAVDGEHVGRADRRQG